MELIFVNWIKFKLVISLIISICCMLILLGWNMKRRSISPLIIKIKINFFGFWFWLFMVVWLFMVYVNFVRMKYEEKEHFSPHYQDQNQLFWFLICFISSSFLLDWRNRSVFITIFQNQAKKLHHFVCSSNKLELV